MKTDKLNQLMAMLPKFGGEVVVLAGGQSAERAVSLKSGAAVFAALQALSVPARLLDTGSALWFENLCQKPGLCFIALHGPGGEDGTVQGALKTAGLRFTGSDVLGSALAMDKQRSKLLWQGLKVSTPQFQMLSGDDDFEAIFAQLGECIVKPAREGSSIGMSRVSNAAELKGAFEAAAAYGAVMAEQWITGEEYTVSIVGNKPLPAIRLETDNRFYDFEAKYESSETRYICPCGLGDAEAELQQLALTAFQSLGCTGWGRVDVMRDQQGRFYVLEVNTIPGMTDHSLVPMSAKVHGWSFEELVLEILLTASEVTHES